MNSRSVKLYEWKETKTVVPSTEPGAAFLNAQNRTYGARAFEVAQACEKPAFSLPHWL